MAIREIHTDLNFINSSRLLNLPDGVANQEPATVAQLNAAIQGLAWKDDVVAASTANVNISSPGASLDSINLNIGNRILLKNQTSSLENGIYIWNGATTPLTRSTDSNTIVKLIEAIVSVASGTINHETTWRQTQVFGVIDTDPIVWVSFAASSPIATESTAGVIQIATQSETDAGTIDTKSITPKKLNDWVGRLRNITGIIGDGSNNLFNITHNLNKRNVMVNVYRNSGNYDEITVEIRHTDVNTITIVFDDIPTTNQWAYTIIG